MKSQTGLHKSVYPWNQFFLLNPTCETCVRALSFTLGSWLNVPAQRRMWRPSLYAARAETQAWIFQSLKNCWQRARLLCGCFPTSLKQAALVCYKLSDTYRYARVILKGVTPPGVGIHFWADNNQVGLFIPRDSRTTTEPEWGSGKQPAGETEPLLNWAHRFNVRWAKLKVKI